MIIASSVLLVLAIIGLAIFGRKHRGFLDGKKMKSWMTSDRIENISATHTQVTGVLAGFAITIVVLLIGTGAPIDWDMPSGSALIMFIVSFFGYVTAGVLYSLVAEREAFHRAFLFCSASMCYLISVSLSFSALLPLLSDFSAPDLILLCVAIQLAAAAVGGHLACFIPISDGFRLRKSAVLLILLVAALVAFTLLSVVELLYPRNLSQLMTAAVALLPIASFSVCFLVSAISFFSDRVAAVKVLRWFAIVLACWSSFVVMFVAIGAIGALDVLSIPFPMQGVWLAVR